MKSEFLRSILQTLFQSEEIIFFYGSPTEKELSTALARGRSKRIMVIPCINAEAADAFRAKLFEVLNHHNCELFSCGVGDFRVTHCLFMLEQARVFKIGSAEWKELTTIEGEEPKIVQIPRSVFHDQNKKEKWAIQILTAHVRARHPGAPISATRSYNYKLTGTSMMVCIGLTHVIYTMVEEGSLGEVRIEKRVD